MALLGGNTERQICDYVYSILFYFICVFVLFCFLPLPGNEILIH